MRQKLVPDPFFILVNNPNSHYMQEIFKIRYLVMGLSKTFLKVNLLFLSNAVPFNGQSYQKQKGRVVALQVTKQVHKNF